MSLFNWFRKSKPAAVPTAPRTASGLPVDATQPIHPGARSPAPVSQPGAHPALRRQERQALRELLYTVVRESMNKVGVLSSGYKFKVLSLDSKGRQYLVMMDLAPLQPEDVARLSTIEHLIAQTARARHDILVTAVYWRISEQVSTQLPNSQPMPLQFADSTPAGLRSSPAPLAAAAVGVVSSRVSAAEPLHPDEMAAFHQALAAASRPVAPQAQGNAPLAETVKTGPLPSSSRPSGFADTEMDDRAVPLSATQYGDL